MWLDVHSHLERLDCPIVLLEVHQAEALIVPVLREIDIKGDLGWQWWVRTYTVLCLCYLCPSHALLAPTDMISQSGDPILEASSYTSIAALCFPSRYRDLPTCRGFQFGRT